MVYSPGQFNTIVPYIRTPPSWLLLAGPSDGNEAQCAVKAWPGLRGIGCEPNKRAIEWQLQNGWPQEWPLLPVALGDVCGIGRMTDPPGDLRHNSLDPEHGGTAPVGIVTLDMLAVAYGPFPNSVLWMDIEGYEVKALHGAGALLERDIMAVNLEVMRHQPNLEPGISNIMTKHGFGVALEWGTTDNRSKGGRAWCNKLYVKV